MEVELYAPANQAYPAIAQLVYRLFRGLDEKNDRLVGSLFAPHGTWERQGKRLTGPEEVVQALAQREPGRSSIHVISNLQVMREDGCMVATYYLTAYVGKDAATMTLAAILDCRDEIVSTEDGFRISAKSSRRMM